MSVHQHLSEFGGLPVVEFADFADGDTELPEGGEIAWAVRTYYDHDPFDDVFQRFVERVDTTSVTHLVFGYWGADYDAGSADPVRVLTNTAERFPELEALFLGDIVSEESEISWIEQTDITPLFSAFPVLERLEVRGGQGLELAPVSSSALKVLRFESGGLPAAVVRAVGESDLPNLEVLEMWLGDSDYGGDAAAADLAGILGGKRLPALRRLGLMNSEIQDEICAAVATAPILPQLSDLLLSMGVLTDEGAEALLSGQPLTHLRSLDLQHHYLTEPMMERLRAALPGVRLELDPDRRDGADDDWRYVAVSE